jgi:Dual specificity protein phosphatase, N-terminal half
VTQEYEPFYGDFGPLNMGHTFEFCTRTASLLQVFPCRVFHFVV